MTSAAVTVAIPTCGRPAALLRAVDGLARQQGMGTSWEVLVVDNAGDGSTVDAGALRDRLPVPLRVVHEPARGASHSRNRAIAEAATPIVAFLDDDVEPAPTWLAQLVAPVADGRFDAVCGRVLLDDARPLPVWLYEGALGYLAQLDLGPATRALGADEFLITASAAFRAEVLRASGGFDPALGPQPGSHLVNDDVLVTRRVRAVGGVVGYVGESCVVHELPPERLRLSWMLSRLYDQGRSDWRLERVDRDLPPAAGLADVLRTVGQEVVVRGRQGLWHRPVAFRLAGEVVRAIGFGREVVTALVTRRRRP